MKPQGTQVRSVVYDARARQFEAEVSFLDVRGMQRRFHVTAPGTPDQDHARVLDALIRAAKTPRVFKGAQQ
jgi:hypothetical protein